MTALAGPATTPSPPSQVAKALEALSDADLLRLELFAKFRAAACPWIDWKDLIQEAIERALGGSRRWPNDLPFPVFLRETIRSIASEEVRRHAERPMTTEADLPVNQSGDSAMPIEEFPHEAGGPEQLVSANQLLANIFERFAGDTEATAVLEGMALGLTPSEICTRHRMTRTQYATAQRRIRRRLADNGKESPI